MTGPPTAEECFSWETHLARKAHFFLLIVRFLQKEIWGLSLKLKETPSGYLKEHLLTENTLNLSHILLDSPFSINKEKVK
jgi:hypothetical protein